LDVTDRLWAPWRMEFIREERAASTTCFLCDYVGVAPSAGTLVLARRPHAYVVLNRYPYNPGHIMVVPNAHVKAPSELSTESSAALFQLLIECIDVLKRATRCQGVNVGMNLGSASGAGVEDHLHVHLVPRWNGDSNFMSVTGNTRVVPEALEQTRVHLAPWFEELTLST
jgi:ATP adenylyltransferase